MDNDHDTAVVLPWDGMPEDAFRDWRKLYATNPKYRDAWDRGVGPGQSPRQGTAKKKPHGPGTELTKLFRPIRPFVRANCNCAAHAAEMDRRGCDWCETNLAVIVGWLEEEAALSKLPFDRPMAEKIVEWAIRRARRKERKVAKAAGVQTRISR